MFTFAERSLRYVWSPLVDTVQLDGYAILKPAVSPFEA